MNPFQSIRVYYTLKISESEGKVSQSIIQYCLEKTTFLAIPSVIFLIPLKFPLPVT